MGRIIFILAALVALAVMPPSLSRAQTPAPQADADEVGNVASVQGAATATRNGASRRLNVQDPIYKGDLLRTGVNAALGIIFDDETTFNLSANSNITVDEFVYQDGGSGNSALFNIARGTIAFAANAVAKTGDMKIATPSTTLGIRGTSGVVEVPEGAAPGTPGEVAVKLYQDEDGRVGRIELFGARGGPRLGLLTRAATGFSLRAGGGGRFAAVPLTISPQQMARDRGFVQRTFAARSAGRQLVIQRRSLRGPGLQRQPGQRPGIRQPNLRQPGQPNLRQQGLPRPGALPPGQQVRPQGTPGVQGQPGPRNNLQRQNPRPQNAPSRRKPPPKERR